MEHKDQVDTSSAKQQAANINIDINGDADDSGVKNMNLDASTECRVGLSKEELMKYANQPFWVRLRNILFASFWIVWVSILIAAIGYVVNSPGCARLVSADKSPDSAAAALPTAAALLSGANSAADLGILGDARLAS